jgi:serine/threonine protein kinase
LSVAFLVLGLIYSQNIFPILLDDRILRIKIGDFGVSKRLSKDSSTVAQTQVGSQWYMAPEVVSPGDSDGHTTSVDLWALGCVVYRMITGGLPFPTVHEVNCYGFGIRSFPRQELELVNLSNAGLAFIESLVKADPEKRATAELALKSDWITSGPSGPSGFQVTTNLESYLRGKVVRIPASNTTATEPQVPETSRYSRQK